MSQGLDVFQNFFCVPENSRQVAFLSHASLSYPCLRSGLFHSRPIHTHTHTHTQTRTTHTHTHIHIHIHIHIYIFIYIYIYTYNTCIYICTYICNMCVCVCVCVYMSAQAFSMQHPWLYYMKVGSSFKNKILGAPHPSATPVMVLYYRITYYKKKRKTTIYTYTHNHICIYTHTYIHIHICIYTHTYIHKHIRYYTHTPDGQDHFRPMYCGRAYDPRHYSQRKHTRNPPARTWHWNEPTFLNFFFSQCPSIFTTAPWYVCYWYWHEALECTSSISNDTSSGMYLRSITLADACTRQPKKKSRLQGCIWGPSHRPKPMQI
jgi:hypothetical protein